MLVYDYLKSLPLFKCGVNEIEKAYNCKLPGILKQLTEDIVRLADESDFEYIFSDEEFIRLLSVNEILYPLVHFGIEFKALGYIPLFDLSDNVFIVYNINKSCLGRYNLDTGDFYLACSTIYGVLPSC